MIARERLLKKCFVYRVKACNISKREHSNNRTHAVGSLRNSPSREKDNTKLNHVLKAGAKSRVFMNDLFENIFLDGSSLILNTYR